ncbi:DUF2254 domain-containing protein [Iodidimonas sp. SYSU 1G8]|uniref:DUF2254 domain-containing protein n=1 Tax=Iodidimonas sp. SYSU 1G8 TaxID=3133967 RepID=UPI0031FF1FBA
MDTKWQFILQRITRQTWFRSTLYCLLGVATAMVAIALGPMVPEAYSDRIGAGSVDSILAILASSMLAVATFSLTTMVSAYAAASNSTTPRAATLLIEDTTSHNALATFIGAFLYSIVGIVLLSTRVYGGGGRLVLLAVTIAVIVLVVVTLLGWIDRLSRLGRVGETIDQVEEVTQAALNSHAKARHLGGHPLTQIPADAYPLYTDRVAYVQHVDAGRLQNCAETADVRIYNPVRSGVFISPGRALCYLDRQVDDATRDRIRAAFTLGDTRTFLQDPRFGLIALSEIASRALSPAINDPGTAIDVIGTMVRLLIRFDRDLAESDPEVIYDRLHAAPIDCAEMIEDAFRPISRDGAALVEVGIRLQKGLASISHASPTLRPAALRMSDEALERARGGLSLPADIAEVVIAHELVQDSAGALAR